MARTLILPLWQNRFSRWWRDSGLR